MGHQMKNVIEVAVLKMVAGKFPNNYALILESGSLNKIEYEEDFDVLLE